MNGDIEFERNKIYEKLQYQPEPQGYSGKLPWIVQQQISATNGIQYGDRVGKLKKYPQYALPVKKVAKGIMLDIGTGWGRWLVAGSKRGYIPVGLDVRLEFCQTALQTLHNQNKLGYAAVADLKEIPFKESVFDLVWSFSVIQHTHKERMVSCLQHIKRILKPGGFTKLQFPNANGIRNKTGPAKINKSFAGDYNSWKVRYYSIKEYKEMFDHIFENCSFSVHSFLGIGVLKEDLFYVSWKNKMLCTVSLLATFVAKTISPLKNIGDSIYIKSKKEGEQSVNDDCIKRFLDAHKANPLDNLNIIHLLQCPVTLTDLKIIDDKNFVISASGEVKYPVIHGIPILIRSEAVYADSYNKRIAANEIFKQTS
jgi:ubiquinone/menaquinone biosynthesis C-methylase UbiE/uncharacterized protein YbaR (Trm112 family)